MQAVAWERAAALKRLGRAMAHSKPMIAITIMISTSVKPLEPLLVRVVFILFARREPQQADYFIITICSQIACWKRLRFQ